MPVFIGTEEQDRLDGTDGADLLHGLGARDILIGMDGDDTLQGDAGGDLLLGGNGNDLIFGGLDGDHVNGDVGDDTLVGGAGSDSLRGGGGLDMAVFDDPFDSVTFSFNTSILRVHHGTTIDVVFDDVENLIFDDTSYDFAELAAIAEPYIHLRQGVWFAEWIHGNALAERIEAGGGNDVVRAGDNDDILLGQEGDDTLAGELGDDTLIGGEGADTYWIRAGKWGEGDDVIADFERGSDAIDFRLADILREDPSIMSFSGDTAVLELSDLDASTNWRLDVADNGNVTIHHESGSIELQGIAGSDQWDSFTDLADVLTVDGAAIPVGGPTVPDGESGPNTIIGQAWAEWLKGTAEAETLDALAGNDVLRGYGGDDTLLGGEGEDTLRGEAGDDVLTGGAGADVFAIRTGKWGEGADTITDFEIGIDTVDLSSISLGAEIADLAGLSGDTDTLELSDLQLSADWVVQSSDEGWVEFVHPTGSVTFEGVVHDTDTDFFYDLAGVFTLDGTIIPTGPFMIDGGNGDIIGGPLNDSIAGSDDMQIIMGWGGDDTLQGRGGDDAIYGSVGDDWIDGGASNDYLLGGPGDDYVLGGEGRDQIEGSIGNDTLDGGAGDDLLWDHDAVIDEPYESNDLLIGGEGDDRLLAENGSDTLIGGSGFDQMTGGTGADVFRIFAGRPDEGGDVILDFERGLDTLDFSTADMLAADPGLAALAGDPAKLELMDLDASVHWGIGPVANPDQPAEQIVAIAHPTGWVTLTTILHGEDSDSFADLVDVITFDGAPPPDAESPNGDCSDPQPIEIPDGDWIGGSGFDDCLRGSNQNDLLYALAGDDVVHGFVGDDTLFGGEGDDTLIGGSGIDILEGGAGADVFRMAVGQDGDIVDSIMDFERGVDTLDLSLADLLAVDPNLAARAGDPASIELVDLDASAFFDVGQWTNTTQIGEPVFTTITHPTGLIGLATVAYGDDADSFADLADILTLDGQAFAPPPAPTPDPDTITGNPWNEWLKGTGEADSLDALAGDDVVRGYGGDDTLVGGTGDDTLRGEAGDDQLTGGEGADVFRVRSGKWGQGDDTVTDFELGTDKLVFVAADMLKDDPNLAGADGVLGLDDLEASDDFALGASADGDLLISHQTGSVEIDDLAFDATTDSFTEISPILEIEVA